MTIKFTAFTKQINEIEMRKQTAEAEENRFKKLLIEQNELYNIAELSGQPTKNIKDNIEEIENQLKDLDRKLKILTSDPKTIINFIKNDKTILSQAQIIFDDNTKCIEEMQNEYDDKVQQLQEIKQEYLKIVAEMGEIRNASEIYSKEKNKVCKYLKGLEHSFFVGIETDVNPLRKTGSIFLQTPEVEAAFKKGVL